MSWFTDTSAKTAFEKRAASRPKKAIHTGHIWPIRQWVNIAKPRRESRSYFDLAAKSRDKPHET
jgi:hypothetical protein